LGRAAADSVLVITAIAHTDPIKTAARTMGFRGEIFDWDTNGNHS
jgi:hypothetical protein